MRNDTDTLRLLQTELKTHNNKLRDFYEIPNLEIESSQVILEKFVEFIKQRKLEKLNSMFVMIGKDKKDKFVNIIKYFIFSYLLDKANLKKEEEIHTLLEKIGKLNLVKFGVIVDINKEKYSKFVKMCKGIFLKYCANMSLSCTFLNKSEEKDKYFIEIKSTFLEGDVCDIYNIIKEINRGFIPYNIDKKVMALFDILINYSKNHDEIVEYLTYIDDPFAIVYLMKRFEYIIDFHFTMIRCKSKKIRCIGFIYLYEFLKKNEIAFIRRIYDKLRLCVVEKKYKYINDFAIEKEKYQMSLQNKLSEMLKFVLSNNNNENTNLKIIFYFLRDVFRYRGYNFQGMIYYFHSVEIFGNCIASILSELVLKDPIYKILKEIYIIDENTIHFYSLVALNIAEKQKKENLIEELMEKVYNDLIENAITEKHPTHFGFEYDNQIDYFNGLCNLYDSYLIIQKKEKKNYISCILETIKKAVFDIEDPFKRQYELAFNKFENTKYLFIFALYMIDILSIHKKCINESIVKEILSLLDIIIREWEFSDVRYLKSNELWSILAKIAKKSKTVKKYYFARLDSIRKMLPLLNLNIKIPEEKLMKIQENLDFDIERMDTNEVLNAYFLVYSTNEYNNVLEYLYKKLPDDFKNNIKEFHELRLNKCDCEIHKIIDFVRVRFKFVKYNYIIMKFLSYWEMYFRNEKKKIEMNIIRSIKKLLI